MTSSADLSSTGGAGPARARNPYLTGRALRLHVTLLVLIPAFIALTVWQVDRAVSGNGLSWAYAFEWPLFGAYAVYMWWRLLHEAIADDAAALGRTDAGGEAGASGHARSAPVENPAEGTEEEDADLAAYNRYLAELSASGRRKHW